MSALEKALRWVVLAGIFALPFICLVVTTSLFFPYITGKNFLFRAIVELIAGATLALALVSPQYRPRRSWILAAFALFVLVIAIADAQGVHPFKSFWSNFERMDGFVTLIHLLLLLIVSVAVLNTEKLWCRFWQVSLTVSIFVALYGFLQIAGRLALGEGGTSGLMARIDATFGNPIYLAVYMLFHIFIAAMLWLQMKAETPERKRLLYTLWYGAAIVLDTVALFFTGTRGTMLGLIGGVLLALVLYALTSEASAKLRRITFGAIIFVVVAGGALYAARDTGFVKSVGFLDRLASISLQDNTTKARLLNMQIAWQGVKEKPVFGWGQENYAIVFDKYYDPQMYAQEPWFDRVHDVVFDWWIAGGTIGLLAYFLIFIATLWVLWRDESGFTNAEKSILTGLLGGYFFHNLFVFDNVTSYILFAFTLGYIAWRAAAASGAPALPQRQLLPPAALSFATVFCAVAVWGAAWYVNADALAQNRTLLTALSQQQGGVMQNLTLLKQAIAYGSYGTQEAREQLAQMASSVSQAQITAATKQAFFETSVSEMQKQEQDSPLDARFPLFIGILQSAFGDNAEAAQALERAHELSPKKQTILFQIGVNQQAQGQSVAALVTFKEAYDLAPENRDAALYYAAEAIVLGQDTLAQQALAPFIPTGEAADTRITSAYAHRGQYGKIVAIWLPYVQTRPQDVQGYFTLAAAYYAAGDKASAIAALQRAATLSPAAAQQAQSVIQQIQNGTIQVQ